MDLLKTLRNLLLSTSSPDPLDRLRIARGGNTNITYIDLALPPEGFMPSGGCKVILARVNDAIMTKFFQRNRSALTGKSFKKVAAHQEAYAAVYVHLNNLGGSDDMNAFQSDRDLRLRKGEVVADDSLDSNAAYKLHIRRQANSLEYQALELAKVARADLREYVNDCLAASEVERAKAEKMANESPLGICPLCYPEPILTLSISVFLSEKIEELSRPVEGYASPAALFPWAFDTYSAK
jgi:hypothetical protein